jgi:hypothetical protein
LRRLTIAVHRIIPFASNPEDLASRVRASVPVLRPTCTVLTGLTRDLKAVPVKLPRGVVQSSLVRTDVLPTRQLAQAAFADRASPARIDPKVAIFLIVIGLIVIGLLP